MSIFDPNQTPPPALVYTFVFLLGMVADALTGRMQQRRAKRKAPPVYHKCKDCGLEHAVYPTGKVHALRPPDDEDPTLAPGWWLPCVHKAVNATDGGGGVVCEHCGIKMTCPHNVPIVAHCAQCHAANLERWANQTDV
jgi:transcription elongation factor Elf1